MSVESSKIETGRREHIVRANPGRRSFLQKLAFAGAVLAGAETRAGAQQISGLTDVDILNFALNLEYLQAEFYTYATTGKGIANLGYPVAGSGAQGATTGGRAVTFTDPALRAIAVEMASNELAHVTLVRSTLNGLGVQPIAMPAINLNAFGAGSGSEAEFLTLARALEDIAVSAYNGVTTLTQNKVLTGVASRILSVQAEQAGNLRLLIAQKGVPTTALDGLDIVPPPSGARSFSANSLGVAVTRTPGEVLALLYGASNTMSGGFFPAGVNGSINASTTLAADDGTLRTRDTGMLTATPNPIISPTTTGATTIHWDAPQVEAVEIRVGTLHGGLLATGGKSGQAQTGSWVVDGLLFFLQDVTGGKGLFPANTLATVLVRVQQGEATPK
jgi:hypothetical protein